jgi:hypothetical protein
MTVPENRFPFHTVRSPPEAPSEGEKVVTKPPGAKILQVADAKGGSFGFLQSEGNTRALFKFMPYSIPFPAIIHAPHIPREDTPIFMLITH